MSSADFSNETPDGEAVSGSWYLTKHVYAGIAEHGAVFLDAKRNKYYGLARRHVSSLSHCVAAWPAEAGGSDPAPAHEVAKLLEQNGILTRLSRDGKSFESVQLPAIDIAQSCLVATRRPFIGFLHCAGFLLACLQTACSLRMLPLDSIIRSLRSTRRAREANSLRQPDERERALDLAAIFWRLKPFVFSGEDTCLFIGLALTRFMSYYAVRPTCVIAVETGPFRAHCWVQHGPIAFDHRPERLDNLIPILSL